MTASGDLGRLTRVLARLLKRAEGELEAAFVPMAAPDLAAVMQLRRQVLGVELSWDDAAYLRWRYFTPSAGRPETTLWGLRDQAGAVIGLIGTEALALHLGSETLAAARYMDVMVEPKLNGLGLGAWMNLELHERHPLALAIGATKDSYNLVRRVFQPLPERHSWKLLVRSQDFLRRKTPRLADLPGVTQLADVALGLGRFALARGYGLGLEVAPIHELGALAPEVAALDAGMAAGGLTFAQRTAPYLSWRYLENPRRRYELLGAWQAGRLAGLVVFRNVGGRGELVDWMWDGRLAEEARTRVVAALFARATERLAEGGATTVWTRTLGLPGELAAARVGMRQRQERDTVAVSARSPGLGAALASARWFLTLGDSDDD